MKRLLVLASVGVLLLPLAASAAIEIGLGSTPDSLTAVEPWTVGTAPDDDSATAPIVGSLRSMLLSADMDGGVVLGVPSLGTVAFGDPLVAADSGIMEIETLDLLGLGGVVGTVEIMSFQLSLEENQGPPGSPAPEVTVRVTTTAGSTGPVMLELMDLDRILISATEGETVLSVTVAPLGFASILAMQDLRVYVPSSNPIPEPSTLACWLLLGLTCVGAKWRRRKSA